MCYRIDHHEGFKYNDSMCEKNKEDNSTVQTLTYNFPGDFSSDAQFYVFVGVMTWLYSSAT